MLILDRLEKFIYTTAPWKLVLAVALLILFKTGIWFTPNLSVGQAIAQNPFVNPIADPGTQYLFWSWLTPFLAWALRLDGDLGFYGLHLLLSVAFSAVYIWIVFSRFPGEMARTALIAFAVLPVSATAYFWVGYDSLTLLLLALALVFPRHVWLVAVLGIGLGMQHFEAAGLGAAGLLVSMLLGRRNGCRIDYDWKFATALLFGIVAGKIALILIFKHNGINVNSGRLYWVELHFRGMLAQFYYHFQYAVWSVLGLGWLLAVKYVDEGRKSLPFFIPFFCLLGLLAITSDQTRVLAIVTFLLVAVYWLLNPEFLASLSRRHVAGLFLIWMLMPWSWVWQGTPRWSVLPYDVTYVLHGLFGWFRVPTNPNWPFI